jgi:spermidine synthase
MTSVPSPANAPRGQTYAAVFFVALATLMLEVLLTRITSVSSWYHLAFFVISLAMLGMTAGAVLVFVRADAFADEHVPKRLAQSSLGFALSAPACVAVALSVPLSINTDFMGFVALLAIGGVLALPFVLVGVTLTLALTRAGLPPGLVYAVDLIGAASGCALVIPVLSLIDAPSAALLAAAVAALASFAFARAAGQSGGAAMASAVVLAALCALNASSASPPLRPAWVKGRWEDPALHIFKGWNSYSRVTVSKPHVAPVALWAPGRKTPPDVLKPIEQRVIEIDGAAGTMMVKLGLTPAYHTYLDWDVTSAAHTLRPGGPAAVIGVGGGRDVIAAVKVGHQPVVGIELNQLIVDLHRSRMRNVSRIADLAGVELVSDEARSYLARDTRRYAVITMSLIDTWASTGTGAYSLSENGLYTTEAWQTFLARLEPRGVLSVSRWYYVDSPGETTRMLALAMDAIWRTGAKNPRDHIIMLQSELVATLLLSPKPFASSDIDRAEDMAVERGFNMLLTPRRRPAHPLLRELVKQRSPEQLHEWSRDKSFDLSPPSDARPFFFNMLRPHAWLRDRKTVDELDLTFLGNLQATQTLSYATLVSLLLTALAIGVPMARRVRELRALPAADVTAALAYFALIGLGFMFVEIGLLSRLSVFLGHPTLALAVLLGGLILFTGVGSSLSGGIDITRPKVALLYPLVPCALSLAAAAGMDPLMRAFSASSTPSRVMVSLALVAIPALGLGLGFPLGLRLCELMEQRRAPEHGRPRLGPWLWGINGAFGVCASGLGLGISMIWGIPTTLLVGALCYLLLPLATQRLSRA